MSEKILIHSGDLEVEKLSQGNWTCSCDLEGISLLIQYASKLKKPLYVNLFISVMIDIITTFMSDFLSESEPENTLLLMVCHAIFCGVSVAQVVLQDVQ